jgi:NAD(P)H-hydrate epimerase
MHTPHPPQPPADLPGLPPRPRDGHKGTFGTVAVIGGCCAGQSRMIGAPALAAMSALRAGAGLAKLVMPAPILSAALTICPSATGVPLAVDDATGEIIAHQAAGVLDGVTRNASVLAIGPGLGTSDGAAAATLRVIQQEELPAVIDADALNCMAAMPELFRDLHAAAVLTPHPGEFVRLCAGLGVKGVLGLDHSRERACEQLAQRLGRIVVLKGARTVVSDGLRTWTCPAGHPCLATAGTGDILTGIIAGIIAQHCPTTRQMLFKSKTPAMPADPLRPLDIFDAARIGVWIHAAAGEAWASTHGASGGLLAPDLAALIPAIVESLRHL